MSSLFVLTGERLELQNKLTELNLDEDCIADTLEGESAELTEKIKSYGYIIRNRQALIDSMDAEIKRMTERMKSEESRLEKIEQWLLSSMFACGIEKVEGSAFTIKAGLNAPSVDILDLSAIPSAYWRTPEPVEPVAAPDKRLILSVLKDGELIAGCALKRTKKLTIK
jgi:hypothetical protein